MLIFGSGMSEGPSAYAAAREAAARALETFAGATPKLGIVFGSLTYPDVESVPRAIRDVVGEIPLLGGTSGACVIGPRGIAARGVSVVLVGGDDIEVETRVACLDGPDLINVVPAAQEIAHAADDAAKRGFEHYVCFVIAPGIIVDGEALVTAMDREGFAVNSGSSCTASTLEPSHVLVAMGALTHGNVRVSLPRGIDETEVERFLVVLPRVVAQLRADAGVAQL